jgi:hypothetical protein
MPREATLRSSRWYVLCGLPALFMLARPAAGADWLTECERTDGQATARYEQTIAYCQRLAQASVRLQYAAFGRSGQGRELPLLIADAEGRFSPAASRARGAVVLLVQACIHAGEVCGKDAGLMLLRDLTVGEGLAVGEEATATPGGAAAAGGARLAGASGLPSGVTILFIPILNVDGYERWGPYNRANQNGPREMGWRANATNLNLNRDYLKADTPEIRAWLDLFRTWRPDFLVDIHATDGADYQYAITYAVETEGGLAAGPAGWLREVAVPRLEKEMAAAGWPLFPYIVFRRWGDPTSGLRSWAASPRFSQGYAAVRNRPALLVETHMLKPYRARVQAAYELLARLLDLLADEHERLRRVVRDADAATGAGVILAEPFPLSFELAEDESVMVDFAGFAHVRRRSQLTGGTWLSYSSEPVTYRLPYLPRQRPLVSVELPEAYLVPPEWVDVLARLELHGVRLERLAESVTLTVRSYRFTGARWATEPYEGRHPVTVSVQPVREERTFPVGTAVVDMRQPDARLIAHALEPQGPDSFVRWGFFDAVFARVEYIEPYVLEPLGAQMVSADDSLAAALAHRKAASAGFAADPDSIRDWLYQRTPYFDDRYRIYPVAMVDDRDVVSGLPFSVSAHLPIREEP